MIKGGVSHVTRLAFRSCRSGMAPRQHSAAVAVVIIRLPQTRYASTAPSSSSVPPSGLTEVSASTTSTASPEQSQGIPEVGVGAPLGWTEALFQSNVVMSIQSGLEAIHSSTGLPWWATFAVSTLAIRVALLPLVRLQDKAAAQAAKAGPLVGLSRLAVATRLDSIAKGDRVAVAEALRAYWRASSAGLQLYKVKLLPALVGPVLQISALVSFTIAIRRMIAQRVPGLNEGGLAWFKDLSEPDELLILPIVCLASTYLNIDLGFSKLRETQNILRFVKDNLQLLLIVGAPAVASLPAGVFMYWLPSTLFSHALHFALRSPRARKILRLTPLPEPRRGITTAQILRGADPSIVERAVKVIGEYESRHRSKRRKERP